MPQVEPFLTLGETSVTVARPYDEESRLALSALIRALYESETYAIARLVSKDNKDPVILLMRPSIDLDFECLYDAPLPFAEDVRSYRFPPLDKVVTITGKVLTEHPRLLPDDKLNQAMSDYVDAMDISEFGHDDEGWVFWLSISHLGTDRSLQKPSRICSSRRSVLSNYTSG